MSFCARDIVARYGEPEQKAGGRSVPITLVYSRLGLQCDLRLSNWEDADNPLASVVFFRPAAPAK